MSAPHPPRATYRLQLHAGFTFDDARAVVPYLAKLGVSHVYTSPITTACAGSIHGYDVVDPTRVSPELGGEEGLAALVDTLRAHGMGLIIDIVPNHLGVAGDANAWWLDVLAHGPDSEHAATFDIDWNGPLVLPVLGSPLEEVIAAGDLRLVARGSGLGLRIYGGAVYPVRPDDPIHGADRDALLSRQDPAMLAELAGRQHYRLTFWRAANDTLNWRRFFAINELAGVRTEDPAVFARTHGLYLDLYRRGLIDGVRVDHVDGLTDPAAYCRRLRAALEKARPGRRAYIVVEKILAPGERLPPEWEVDGTTGYDFMRDVSALLHDPAGEAPLRELWHRISGRSEDFADEALTGRRDMLAWQFEGQLNACVAQFAKLAESAGKGWITRGMLRRAIERLLWVFPVYRTYGTGSEAPEQDREVREHARVAAAPCLPPGEGAIADLILEWLAGEGEGDLALKREAVRRFQQLAAPVAAKGVEDTAFYRHGALLSANDVGLHPGTMAEEIAAFHDAMRTRAEALPASMLATGTHDHKRGEDARARLAVLSAVPERWAAAVARWTELTARHAAGIDPADRYMLFQTLVGAWEPDDPELLPRIQAWQRKALREARLRSSWEAPDEAYESLCAGFAAALVGPAADPAFTSSFSAFMADLAPAAEANGIAQTVLHYCAPGVSDLYEGAELLDYSMVDPDNRRPVDFPRRAKLLGSGRADWTRGGKLALIADLLALRGDHPAVFTGDYVPLRVTGSRSEHLVAFSRRAGDEWLHCAVAVRLGEALFGGGRASLRADWWEDTRISVMGSDTAVGDRLAGALYAIWID